uniref:Inositol polyphosphate-related phosphatase domain-containing protein n=1 Tax=Strombidium inclinatum TaxID=197538 RepID=A0A7S3IHA1_9SPIT|mmetsp:Transcript_19071/g.29258  ORF Transcript_19071/g.29258 Transcript_19071/m.29258 type:complete len:232 (+) Transcript_19071:1956-2651(+)
MPRKKKAGHVNEMRRLKRIEEQKKIEHFDAVVWLGDLNYRIQANDIFAVRRLMELDKWEELLKNDQLHLEKSIMRVAVGYQEGPIHFAPTFKFSAGTQKFNTKREPSWTDRIIFRSKDRLLKQISYDSNNEVTLSDHRPVFSQFLLKFKGDPTTLENRITQARESIKKKKKEKKDNQVLPFNPNQAKTTEENIARIPTFEESNHQYTEIIENMKSEVPNFNSSKSKACEIF